MEHNLKTICITGSSGYVGEMLVDQFSKREDVAVIIGIDKNLPSDLIKNNSKFVFIHTELASLDWQQKLIEYKPQIIIHTAWQIRELRDKNLQYRLNIEGSDMLFDFVFAHSFIKKLIHFSTVASYGAFPENTIEHLFTEEEPFRKTDYFYAEEKRIIEERLKNKFENSERENKNIKVYTIRPSAITGPRGRFGRIRFGLQSVLSGEIKQQKSFWYKTAALLASYMPITQKWCRQFVHEDDITDIVELLSFSNIDSDFEIFNVTPPGDVVLGKDMAQAVHKKTITIHPRLVQCMFFIMRTISFGKIPTSKGGWKSYSYPIVVDGSKITKKYNYQYHSNSLDAFVKNKGRYEE